MELYKNQIIAFLFGLGATITIRFIGIFAISDLVALVFLPFLVVKRNMFADKKFRIVIILLLLWMTSAIVSDIYNHTILINALKGFFSLVPFLACLIFAYWMLRKDYKLMVPFLWGYAISFTLAAGFGLDAFYQESLIRQEISNVSQLGHYNKIIIWIATSFITGAFCITYFKKYPYFVSYILFLFSFVPLIEGSRSLFLISFLVSVLLIYILRITKGLPWDGKLWQQRLKNKMSYFIIFAMIAIFTAKSIYAFCVTEGYLGDSEKQKFEMQNDSKIGLLSGRGEIVASYLALKDSPLLGLGSYAKDTKGYGYKALLISGADNNSLSISFKQKGDHYIPTHSHLWQAWVYNGILGGVFWIYILIGVLYVFITNSLFSYPKYQAYILSALASSIWTILFSPFSQRPLLSTTIVFFIILMRKSSLNKYTMAKKKLLSNHIGLRKTIKNSTD